jgi:hypothetical protein
MKDFFALKGRVMIICDHRAIQGESIDDIFLIGKEVRRGWPLSGRLFQMFFIIFYL